MKRVPLFAANWKMNLLQAEVSEYVPRLLSLLADIPQTLGKGYEIVLAPAAVHLPILQRSMTQKGLAAAAQNCGPARFGAFTGEISPAMLTDLGVGWVIVGHSERRHVFGEDDKAVATRLQAALAEGLRPILCVGETLAERKAGKTKAVVETQLGVLKQVAADALSRITIAYEPVWAIGTGENATPAQAQEVHAFIRRGIGNDAVRVLYGGSVKPENAESLLAESDVDGVLVGGASLTPAAFAGIVRNGLKSGASEETRQ